MSGAPQSSIGFPLPTNLGGTSVSVTSGGVTAPAFLFYSSSTQLDALLPSNLPAGSATLTVSYNSQTSAPVTFNIVTSSFGIFTANAQGTGYGIITNSQYQVFSSIAATEAGDVVTLWGTGLGPVSGDESAGPLPGNLSSVPVQVWVGLQPAVITYQGRSGCCAGLDQIAFTVPSGVTDCAIPIAVQIGAVVSNFEYIPIGDRSRVCSTAGIPSVSDFLSQLQTENRYNGGDVFLTHQEELATPSTAASTTDIASAQFFSFPAVPSPFVPEVGDPPLGTCTVYPFDPGIGPSTTTPLDAGTALTLSGPAGLMQLPQGNPGGYAPSEPLNPSFLTPGVSYTVTGSGGANVGPFTSTVSVPQQFQWTNQNVTSISQSQGLQVSWSGADPEATMWISGYTLTLTNPSAGAQFACRVPASGGQFTVPPFVLYSLPISSPLGISAPLGALTLQEESGPTVFSATGLDLAYSVGALSIISNNVTYGP